VIKAVIFDCFGVLTNDGWLPLKNKYFGHDEELFEKASELNRQSNARQLSYPDFISAIAELAGVSKEEVRRGIESQDRVRNDELFSYIKTLKPDFKIGMLSNASSNMLSELFTKDQIALFDEIVLSFDTGVTKPDEQAYKMVARKLGVQPGQCVFIDDQQRHVAGARQAGMQPIIYSDFDQFKAEFEKLLADTATTNN
jgi:HAD superfamily hydrolase (TIGR01509 family)